MSKRGNVISSVINLGLFVLVNYLFFMTKMTHYWKHPIFNFVFCIFPISLVYILQAVYFLKQKEEEIPTVFGRVKTILATTFLVLLSGVVMWGACNVTYDNRMKHDKKLLGDLASSSMEVYSLYRHMAGSELLHDGVYLDSWDELLSKTENDKNH